MLSDVCNIITCREYWTESKYKQPLSGMRSGIRKVIVVRQKYMAADH